MISNYPICIIILYEKKSEMKHMNRFVIRPEALLILEIDEGYIRESTYKENLQNLPGFIQLLSRTDKWINLKTILCKQRARSSRQVDDKPSES